MFHKVAAVAPDAGCTLNVLFRDGSRKRYDMRRLFDRWPVFRQLAMDEALFRRVRVDAGGYGVSWNDDLDVSCDELYDYGLEDGGMLAESSEEWSRERVTFNVSESVS